MPAKCDLTLAPWLPLDPTVAKAHGCYRDSPYAVTVTLKNADDTPRDISGGSFIAQIRTARLTGSTGGVPLETFDVDDTDAATGVLILGLTETQTKGLALKQGTDAFYDVQDTVSGETYLTGKFRIFDDVSRA